MFAPKRSLKSKTRQSQETEELRAQLAEAKETLRAIREGEVDAVIVSGSKGEQVFSLVGAESIYRLIVETMKEAAFTITFEGQILYCNARFGEFIKRPTGQILGHRLQEFVDPHNRSSVDSLLIGVQDQPVKQRLVFADAEGCPVAAHISANVLNQPDELSICVVATDLRELENSTEMIHQLRRQKEALHESEQRFRSVLENSQDVIYRLNVQTGSFEYISPSAQAVTGFSSDELMALSAEETMAMIHPEDRPVLRAAWVRLDEAGQGEAEYRQWIKSGNYRWLSNCMSLTRDGSGRPLYREGSIRDITERKQQELEIKRANNELEERVHERTEQLRALAGELTLAEQRERKRLAKILHDHIQQLLVAIRYRVAVIRRDERDTIKQTAKEIEELIDQSIAASRSLTAELSPLVLQEGGLNAGLEWLTRWMADKQQLHVDLEMDTVEPLTETTKILLFESVRELLLNAVKHSKTRSARIHLKSAEGLLQLVVSDEGVGFDPKTLPHAGESGGGFGLFSISERLRLIGGKVEINSSPGKGSRFVLWVPTQDTTRISDVKKTNSAI
jgi:PAS domain S-box-containing protein